MDWIEASGKTIEEAVEAAAAQLGVSADQLQTEVVEEGSKGILGLGHTDVKIKAAVAGTSMDVPGIEAGEKGQRVLDLLSGILAAMEFDTKPVLIAEDDEEILIDIRGASEDIGRLIGRQGQTLDALQYILAVSVNRRDMYRTRIILDAEGYRDRHQKQLEQKAREFAEAVKGSGEEAVFEPQSPRDRRIVHMALADNPDIITYSEGEGDDRHVVISPRK